MWKTNTQVAHTSGCVDSAQVLQLRVYVVTCGNFLKTQVENGCVGRKFKGEPSSFRSIDSLNHRRWWTSRAITQRPNYAVRVWLLSWWLVTGGWSHQSVVVAHKPQLMQPAAVAEQSKAQSVLSWYSSGPLCRAQYICNALTYGLPPPVLALPLHTRCLCGKCACVCAYKLRLTVKSVSWT